MKEVMTQIGTSLRVVVATLLVCCGLYTLILWGIAQAVVPHSANGSLITNAQGQVVGSELIAQNFAKPEYLWPRPSAAGDKGYDAASAGGSNLSPNSKALRERVQKTLEQYPGASGKTPLPVDLVTMSGSGLDPHITQSAAMFQAGRIAEARHLDRVVIEQAIKVHAVKSGSMLAEEPLVNVLLVNLELDKSVHAKNSEK
jgi:potassium-transporting ATPase KdpC subunit